MASSDKELEQQLMDAGNKLLAPPSSLDELLPLLDQIENCVSKVEKSPTKSMQNALAPYKVSLKALAADRLFSYLEVKAAAVSCISKITRITAPGAPYVDDRMKDVFQLILSSFRNLSNKFSRSYNERTSILDTVEKVRPCVLMLDFERDALLIEMFQNFLSAIRDYHPENVFTSMETIMALVLKESESISAELLSPLLATLKRSNEEVLPIARKLGEKVLENCANKFKPYLKHAVKSSGVSLDGYSDVVASICKELPSSLKQIDSLTSDENKVDESTPVEASLNEATQAGIKIAAEAGSPKLANPTNDKSPKSVVSNGVARTSEDETLANSCSLKKQDHSTRDNQSKSVDTSSNPDPNSSDMLSFPHEATAVSSGSKKNVVTSQPSSPEDDDRASSPKSAVRPKEVHQLETPKSNSKRLRASENEKGSKTQCYDHDKPVAKRRKVYSRVKQCYKHTIDSYNASNKKNKGFDPDGLVGTRVKVYWPKDEEYYAGTIVFYNADTKKHKVLYDDEDEEILNLKTVKWAFIKDDPVQEEVSSPKLASKLTNHLETPKTECNRKRLASCNEKGLKTPDYDPDGVVGSRVKVYWPMYEEYYAGTIYSYNAGTKKHKVLYDDGGDEEILNLKSVKWAFIKDDLVQEEVSSPKSAAKLTNQLETPKTECNRKRSASCNEKVTSSKPDFGGWLASAYGDTSYSSQAIVGHFQESLGKMPSARKEECSVDLALSMMGAKAIELLNLSHVVSREYEDQKTSMSNMRADISSWKGKAKASKYREDKFARERDEAIKERDTALLGVQAYESQVKDLEAKVAEMQLKEAELSEELDTCVDTCVSRTHWYVEHIHIAYQGDHPEFQLCRPQVAMPSTRLAAKWDVMPLEEQHEALLQDWSDKYAEDKDDQA